jgi:hypothetical protein
MRFDTILRSSLGEQISSAADQLKEWQEERKLEPEQEEYASERIRFFRHVTNGSKQLQVGGVDGSGDFPVLSFEDTFIHFAVAHATRYRSGRDQPEEVGPEIPPPLHLAWIPEEDPRRSEELDRAFENLSGRSIEDVVEASDYRVLKEKRSGRSTSVRNLVSDLVRPHASDSGNLSIQLRSTAELGAALRLIRESGSSDFVLIDGTLSLPFVGQRGASLFHEHLKRLCCVEARERNVCFAALSKSHGLPGMEAIEDLAADQASEEKQDAEHWYLRLPISGRDAWGFAPSEGRLLPPPGAVTYLVRFHTTTPVMRVDLDRYFWEEKIDRGDNNRTIRRERELFEALDYMCHDMRAYGYPYPIKAAHDRASMTKKEREALRSKLVDEAVRRGVSIKRLRDASTLTKHA